MSNKRKRRKIQVKKNRSKIGDYIRHLFLGSNVVVHFMLQQIKALFNLKKKIDGLNSGISIYHQKTQSIDLRIVVTIQ